MRLLLIHSDKMEYEVTKEIKKIAEKITDDKKKGQMEECLVVFASVEKGDEPFAERPDPVIEKIIEVATSVKTKNILLYPYAHLSSELMQDSETVIKILKRIENDLKEQDYIVMRSPFGWYKSFDIKCKGHPLSELSSTITPGKDDDASQALKSEEKMVSKWFVLDLDGNLNALTLVDNKPKGFDFQKHEKLKTFVNYEMAKDRTSKSAPPHIELMQKLELVDYEPGSDPGNFRYYPKGRMVKSLLERYVTQEVQAYGGMEIESPIMYDYNHPSLKSYLNRFPARQYTIQSPDKKLFLRFAACFGQFLMLHDATLSYKHLPIRLYELTRYSFRVEQRGELAGIRRLRAFTMPDCHALCRDLPQAKEEMLRRFELSRKILTNCGIAPKEDLEFAIRITKEFWDNNKDFVVGMVRNWGKPALVEMWDERFFYFIMKYEWNFVDNLGKCSALNTDQIDVENGERYGITFAETDGSKKFPLILHLSPSGAIERVIYALLEKSWSRMQKGEKVALPFWLSPTHVRIIPVSTELLEDCKALISKLPGRIDLDDREESLSRKIRDAEKEWVPLIAVYGNKEKESGKLAVRFRDGKQQEFTVEELSNYINEQTKGFPAAPLPVPQMMSIRPIFRG